MASKYGDLSCGCISRRRKLCSAILLVLSQTATALPQGGQVVAGSADLTADTNTLVVNQQSDRAVIDYQSFNIAEDERVQFIQPNAQSATLNRVVGNDLSNIAGRIDANGQVFLINPNGVLFGENASVDVGSMVVTTLDIDNDDFANNHIQLTGDRGRIENRGSLQAQQGIYLVAPEVVNEGDINAAEVGLISGQAVLIQPEGSGIALLVDDAQMQGTVSQLGEVSAERVLMALQGQANGSAIRNDGLVRAQTISGAGGSIQLLASSGEVHNNGTLSVEGVGHGGTVTIDAVHYSQTGTVTANGGGIGDGGEIDIHTDDTLVLYPDAQIEASAGSEGDGGEIVVYSEQATWLANHATISARGGHLNGDGGFVEVSGREYVSVGGDVDVGADQGDAGLWYIDPTDIIIRATDIGGSFVGSNPSNWTFNGGGATSEINLITLRNALANGNVNINTASAAGSTGNITFDGTLNFNGLGLTRTLTLTADGAIIFTANGFVLDSDLSTGSDGLNFIATAQNGFMMDENSSIHSGAGKIAIVTNSGNATITGLGAFDGADDAISVTANAGRITDAGAVLWDFHVGNTGGGVVLNARDGIDNLQGVVALLDAVSANGDVSFSGADISLEVSRIQAAGTAEVGNAFPVVFANGAVVSATQIDIYSGQTVALPTGGLSVSGDLSLEAQDITDSIGGRNLTLQANNLVINSPFTGGDVQLNTDLDFLSYTNNSSNTITITDADSLTLEQLEPQSGALVINSGAGGDLTLASDINLDGMTGSLSLTAANDLWVNGRLVDTTGAVDNTTSMTLVAGNNLVFAADGGLNAGTGTMSVNVGGNAALGELAGATVDIIAAGNITDANGALANISASSATLDSGGDIGTVADSLEGGLVTLDMTAIGGAYWENDQALTLSNIDVGGDLIVNLAAAGDLTLNQANPILGGDAQFNVSNGRLVIPDAGWNTTGNVTVSAQSVVDTDSTVNLTATDADLSLSGAGGWLNVDFDNLSFANNSSNTITIADNDGLSLQNIRPVSGTTIINTGSGTDLVLAADLDLNGMAGDLSLSAGRDLLVNGTWQDTTGAVDNATNMTLAAAGNIVFAADSAVNAGTGTLAVNTGGNVALGDLAGASVSIVAGANITDANGALANISAPSATLNAGEDIGTLVDSLEGAVSNLDMSADGAVYWANNQALTLSTADAAGDFNIQLTAAGDLTMTQANPSIVGNVQIDLANGQWIVPDLGWALTGDLNVTAQGIVDSDNSVTLNAANADLTLDGAATIFNVDFDSLALQILNGQAVQVVDSDELTITNISTAGNLALTTGGAGDLTIADNTPTLSSDVSIDAGGDLILPDAGLAPSGDLTITANNILDSDSTVDLSGGNAIVTLRDSATATTLNSSFTQLSLTNVGVGTVTVNNDQSLQVDAISSGGDARFVVGGDLNWVPNSPVIGGDLLLDASGDVILSDSGLTVTNGLVVSATDLFDSDHDLTLNAASADIVLSSANTDANWTTNFDELTLQRTGTSNLSITNDRSLVLTSLQAAADFNADVVGDLTLMTNPVVWGNLTLIASGAITVPSSGLSVANNMQLQADSLSDGDTNINLAAGGLDLRLADQNSPTQLTTSVARLSLQQAGIGALTLSNDADVIVTQLQTVSDLSLSAAGDITVMEAAPAVGGDLSLVTTGSGTVRINDLGLSVNGNLTLDAAAVLDTDNDVSLAANNADIRLRNLVADAGFSTQLASSSWDVSGAEVSVVQTGAHSLQAVTASHEFSLSTTGNLTVVPAVLNTTAAVSLDSGTANMVIDNVGLSAQGNLSLTAALLSDGDGGAIQLTANQLALQVGNTALDVVGQLNQVDLTAVNATQIALSNDRALNLSQWNTPVADLIQLAVNGDLTIPANGLSALQRLDISADDLGDGDRQLNLAANELVLSLATPAGDLELQTQAQDLDVSLGGRSSLRIAQTGDLRILDVNADGNAIDISDGNLLVEIADGDLQIEGNIFAADLTADGVREGSIELNVTRGGLLMAQAYSIGIQSTTVDVAQPADAFSPGVVFQLREAETGADSVVLGSTSQNVTVNAIGSDMLINVQNTDPSIEMTDALVIADGSSLNAYNQNTDAITGQVLINDVAIDSAPGLVARDGRSISLKYSAEPFVVENESNILDELGPIEDFDIVPDSASPVASLVDIQFNKVFGQCNDADENDQQRCRVNAALKSFLSHWLVGGELPPKSDI